MASYSKSDKIIDFLEEILKDIDEIKKTMDETFKVNVDGDENHTQVDEKKMILTNIVIRDKLMLLTIKMINAATKMS